MVQLVLPSSKLSFVSSNGAGSIISSIPSLSSSVSVSSGMPSPSVSRAVPLCTIVEYTKSNDVNVPVVK